jgi:hypothetical protein
VLQQFSKRAQQRDAVVKQMEEKLGRKLSNNEISHAVHQSRAKKIKGISTAEVREQQLSQLSADDRQSLQTLRMSARSSCLPRIALGENQVLNHVVAHVFERKSVVPEKRKLKVAAGDKLLLQANAVAVRKHFVNGELVEVKRLAGEAIILTDGRTIPADYRTFTHGYAVTSHAAQGKTVDEVLVVASSRSLPAINQQQFYVSISRGRDACRVFTDDAEMLRSHVTSSSARLAAVEVVPRVHNRKFIQTILQRGHRFLKQFRQRRVPRQTILPDNASQQIQPPRYEQKRSSTHRISN